MVSIEEFVRLKPKMYLFLIADNSEHKTAKGVSRNVVATIRHNEYKCLRYSMNRIQSKDHRIRTYEQNFIVLL